MATIDRKTFLKELALLAGTPVLSSQALPTNLLGKSLLTSWVL